MKYKRENVATSGCCKKKLGKRALKRSLMSISWKRSRDIAVTHVRFSVRGREKEGRVFVRFG